MTRAGFVAILGLPNAGKSTLMNALIGTKVSIISHKVQTTRNRIMGVLTEGDAQLVFIDTPGVFVPKKPLEKAMVSAAWDALSGADITLHLVDASRRDALEKNKIISERLNPHGHHVLVLNKVDLIEKDKLLALAAALNEGGLYQATYMISALKGSGLKDLTAALMHELPEGPWFFDEDQLTDMPMRMMAAEMTREKIFEMLHQELPYDIYVLTESWDENDDGSITINQVVAVEKDSQKGIVLGKGGSKIKAIGTAARADMEAFIECKVHLKLFVKVQKNWAERADLLNMIGLESAV